MERRDLMENKMTCKDCKFWERLEFEKGMGKCWKASKKDGLTGKVEQIKSVNKGIVIRPKYTFDTLQPIVVLFGKDFGCVAFKKKNKK